MPQARELRKRETDSVDSVDSVQEEMPGIRMTSVKSGSKRFSQKECSEMEIHMNKGKIVQVMGPVVDVEFDESLPLPAIRDALEVDNNGKRVVMEAAQHI